MLKVIWNSSIINSSVRTKRLAASHCLHFALIGCSLSWPQHWGQDCRGVSGSYLLSDQAWLQVVSAHRISPVPRGNEHQEHPRKPGAGSLEVSLRITFQSQNHLLNRITSGQRDSVKGGVPVDGRIKGINNGGEAIGGTASPILSCSVLDLEHEVKLKALKL